MPEEVPQNTVTLPAADWQTILAGLYELPAKFSVPVINRLQAELQKSPADNVFPLSAGTTDG
jgi:hypothetical protein